MEKNRLKQEEPTGPNIALVESNYLPDKKSLTESITCSDVLGKDVVEEDTGGTSVMVYKIIGGMSSETYGTDESATLSDASQLKLAKMLTRQTSHCSQDDKEHIVDALYSITDNGLNFTRELSITQSKSELLVDGSIASLLTNCILEDDPKDKSHECGSSSPQISLAVCGRKKLLVLNLGGFLADIVYGYPRACGVHKCIRGRTIVKRPFCEDFLKFCFENFDCGIWSARKKENLDPFVEYIMGKFKNKLLFCWDQSKCTDTGVGTLENPHKTLCFKELKKLWNKEETGLPWKKGEFSPSNTVLLDDLPYAALLNPPHTAIFPQPFHYNNNRGDNSFGDGGDIRVYFEQLAKTDDIQQFVKDHPFGQPAITASSQNWNFYSKIIKKHSTVSS